MVLGNMHFINTAMLDCNFTKIKDSTISVFMGNFLKWMTLTAPSEQLGKVLFDIFKIFTIEISFSCSFFLM